MALIAAAAPRSGAGSGYTRLLGDADLGGLLSRVHAAVIRGGNELQAEIARRAPRRWGWNDLVAGRRPPDATGTYLVARPYIEDANGVMTTDFLVLETGVRRALLIELKDGGELDSKKAKIEREVLDRMAARVGRLLPYTVAPRVCVFSGDDKAAIVRGLKGEFAVEEILTGREFCRVVGIYMEPIRKRRLRDARRNLSFLVGSLATIPAVRRAMGERVARGRAR